MIEQEKTEHLVAVSETARRLGYCTESIRRMIKTGKLPAVIMPSGQYRIRENDIEAMLRPVGR